MDPSYLRHFAHPRDHPHDFAHGTHLHGRAEALIQVPQRELPLAHAFPVNPRAVNKGHKKGKKKTAKKKQKKNRTIIKHMYNSNVE